MAHLTASGRCSECGRLQVRFDTIPLTGRLVEIPTPCRCMVEAARPKPPKPKERREWASRVDRDRRLACVCQRCDLPTVGKPKIALYCAEHRAEATRERVARHAAKVGDKHVRAYRARNLEKLRRKAREAYQSDPELRARRNEYKRAYRKLNRDKIRADKERAALRNFRTNGEPIKRWREEVGAGLRKPKRARRNRDGERLCLTPGCRSVMHGRARKCERCKGREAREAAVVLGRAA